MQPKSITQVGLGSSQAWVVNTNGFPAISFGTHITGGPVTYTVELAVVPLNADGTVGTPAAADWLPHPTVAAVSVNAISNFMALPTHIRVTITAVTAPTDSVRLTILQAAVAGS